MKGVITGVPTDVSEDTIKRSLSGAKVIGAKHLKYVSEKEKLDSLSVMVHFDEERLPERVFFGFISYAVRQFVPPPLRCYKCQK